MAKNKGRVADENWWALWPDILKNELAAFEGLGVTARTIHKKNGVLILEAD